ncbi:hypothetical protein EB796_006230 [Bugula neritina]|uniref:Chromo domain-containing protein n=1 Tax=Bugula neritina TaxID=10212 RepID=A0A7J7KD48_BUGNE|nr:hypothetical protein EB796_006230 [Bugula neritina]
MAASTTTASVIKITHCNLCKEVFMQQPNEKPSSRCNKCITKRGCPNCQYVMAIHAAKCHRCGQSMRSLTVKTKQAALAKQFEYGAHRKRKHSLTKQRICNMSAYAHGAGFGLITFMLKPDAREQLTVITSGVSSEHTKESIEAMKDLLLGSITLRPSTASTTASTNSHVAYTMSSTHIGSTNTTTLTNTSTTASSASTTSQVPASRNRLLATSSSKRKLWAIEKICKIRGSRALVKWKGYKTPTWEPVRNVKHTVFYQQLMILAWRVLAAVTGETGNPTKTGEEVNVLKLGLTQVTAILKLTVQKQANGEIKAFLTKQSSRTEIRQTLAAHLEVMAQI